MSLTEHVKVDVKPEPEVKYHPVDRIPIYIKAREIAARMFQIVGHLNNHKAKYVIAPMLIDAAVAIELSIVKAYQETSDISKRIEYAKDVFNKTIHAMQVLRVVYDNHLVPRLDYTRQVADLVAIESQLKNWIAKMSA